MLTSITPLGERAHRRRWTATTAWYLAGSTFGGALVGLLAGALGALLTLAGPARWVLLGVAALGCLLAAAWDARGVRPPSWRRQVDEQWLGRYRGWVVGAGFGAQLGFGVLTIVTSASVYATLLLAALTGSVWGGLLVGVTFGLARALPLLQARRVVSPEALAALHRRLATLAPLARRVTVGVLAVVGLTLGVTAVLV